MSNKFAKALNKQKEKTENEREDTQIEEVTTKPVNVDAISTHERPSRQNTKHIGGYYPPEVSKQLRSIGLDEDKSVQDLIAEALDMLFQSRKKPMIAQKPSR